MRLPWVLTEYLPGELNDANLRAWVVNMREAGKGTGAINSYSRGINSFLAWLYQNGHSTEQLKMKQLKQEQKVLKTFTDAQIKSIVSFKPRTFYEFRLHALLCTLVDTGCRIDEILNLKRDELDFDNLLISVTGKGNKERVIPISFELRKILYRLLGKHQFEFVFCTRQGGRLLYDNLRREFNKLMDKLGIEGLARKLHKK